MCVDEWEGPGMRQVCPVLCGSCPPATTVLATTISPTGSTAAPVQTPAAQQPVSAPICEDEVVCASFTAGDCGLVEVFCPVR